MSKAADILRERATGESFYNVPDEWRAVADLIEWHVVRRRAGGWICRYCLGINEHDEQRRPCLVGALERAVTGESDASK